MNKPNIIVCAAQRNKNYDIIASVRHYWGNVPKLISYMKTHWNLNKIKMSDFGFITKNGEFLSRKESYKIAKENNQLLRESDYSSLISENLYSDTGNPILVCAANYHRELDILVCGVRHYDQIMRNTIRQFKDDILNIWYNHDCVIQGFIDQYEQFYTREEALVLALKTNQRKYRCGSDDTQLFSENLY